MSRKLCTKCLQRPAAINYYKDNKPFYRTKCDHCSKNRKEGQQLWQKAGYKKKNFCEKCSITSKYSDVFFVHYVDGNPMNCRFPNLKTLCSNCLITIRKENFKWRSNNILPDF